MHRIGVIIPSRGDRPQFLDNALRVIDNQSLKPDYVSIQDYAPKTKGFDLVERVKKGVKDCFANNCDLVFIMEDDDYYSSNYIKYMYLQWLRHGTPDIIGQNATIYYHLKLNRYIEMKHPERSSLFTTAFTREILNIKWCAESEIYLDLHLWRVMKGVTVPRSNAMGIKHSIGKCGGNGHNLKFAYNRDDKNLSFLKSIVDDESLKFYKTIKLC
jgi:hypothetical protein